MLGKTVFHVFGSPTCEPHSTTSACDWDWYGQQWILCEIISLSGLIFILFCPLVVFPFHQLILQLVRMREKLILFTGLKSFFHLPTCFPWLLWLLGLKQQRQMEVVTSKFKWWRDDGCWPLTYRGRYIFNLYLKGAPFRDPVTIFAENAKKTQLSCTLPLTHCVATASHLHSKTLT